jgi:hypothetical protein
MKRTCGNCGWGYVKFESFHGGLVWCDWLDSVGLPKLKMQFGDLPESVDKIMLSVNDGKTCRCWTPRRRGGREE